VAPPPTPPLLLPIPTSDPEDGRPDRECLLSSLLVRSPPAESFLADSGFECDLGPLAPPAVPGPPALPPTPSETGERGSSALALRMACCGDAFTGLMGSSMAAPAGPPDGTGAASHGHTLSSSLASSNLSLGSSWPPSAP